MSETKPSHRPLRIAYFAEIFPSKSETWIHHEIIALQKLGCVVRVFATHPRPEDISPELAVLAEATTYMPELRSQWGACLRTLSDPGLLGPVSAGLLGDCPGLRLKAQVVRDILYASKIEPAVSRFAPDLLFAHFAGTRANIALFLSLTSKIPFAVKMHASDVFERVALFRLKTAKAARIFTISDYNSEFMRSHYPDIAGTRFDRHACGIPLSEFAFQPIETTGDTPTILAVGRMVPMKGLDVLLKASRILRDQGHQHRVVIIGYGPERIRLERLRGQMGLDDIVELRGYAAPKEIRTALRGAALFVLPSVWDAAAATQDGIPVSLMEAMALGVPVISTAISGIPELIEDGVNGLLAPPNDSEALAQRIMRGLSMNGAERAQMLRRAREKIEADHDIEKLSANLLDTFEGLICAE